MKIALFLLSVLSFSAQAESWFKGDFHVHTVHSGGDASVSELSKLATERGLDFIAITDHDNKMNGIPLTWDEIAAESSKSSTTLIYGMEWTHGVNWTTCHGHMNIFSDHAFDYSEIWKANQNDNAALAQELTLKAGALFSINHPKTFGFEWNYDFPNQLPALEIWNGAFRLTSSRRAVREVWYDYFNRGIAVSGIGGSDTHVIEGSSTHPTTLGNPTTWVYAKNKSPKAILDGVKKGMTALSFAPDSPVVFLKKVGKKIEIKIQGFNPEVTPRALVLFKNGNAVKVWDQPTTGTFIFEDETHEGMRTWYYAELRGDTGFSGKKALVYGHTLSISNAVTFGFKRAF